MCYCLVGSEGLGAIAVCDKEYPARVAVTMLKELLGGFKAEHGVRWRAATADYACKFPPLEPALHDYQDPAKVDKIMKLDRQLNETKDILYKTIDAVLQRGEKLDELVDKSAALSQQSKMFYKQAKKTNSCCSIA
jgi:synaptobrevin homolog YKT6